MDIYKKRSYWNILLATFGTLILIITLVYSNFLAQKLKDREEQNVKIFAEAVEELNKRNANLGKQQDPIISQFISDQLSDRKDGDADKFVKAIQKLIAENASADLFIQLLLVGSFVVLGYFFLTGSKRSEQNRVWAGMAKETAHQLGTPISAIIAWIEHLKLTDPSEEQLEIVEELRSDVNRLELVADRFSKIGSEPVLTAVNIYEEMDQCRAYMERRAPRKVEFEYPAPQDGNLQVKINKHLFDWVVENLIRNSLDAMDGKGKLSAKIYADGGFINIDLSDTGKGIPSGKHSTVFQPGFTTKQRGWGLGLSLAKRIIENYHQGKIFVKSSKVGEGTTFTIRLPKAEPS